MGKIRNHPAFDVLTIPWLALVALFDSCIRYPLSKRICHRDNRHLMKADRFDGFLNCVEQHCRLCGERQKWDELTQSWHS